MELAVGRDGRHTTALRATPDRVPETAGTLTLLDAPNTSSTLPGAAPGPGRQPVSGVRGPGTTPGPPLRRSRSSIRGPAPGLRRSTFISPPQISHGRAGSAVENRHHRASPHSVQRTAFNRMDRMASTIGTIPFTIRGANATRRL